MAINKQDQLDQFVLDIEFLLISVVQGVALAALGAAAAGIFGGLQFEYWLYVVASFFFILIFWSGAIIHALSFIDWPLNLFHNFLYFLATLIEVIAFSYMKMPLLWFAFIFVFFVVAEILYFTDLSLIKKHKDKMVQEKVGEELYKHILKEQLFEMRTLVPLGIIFNALACVLIFFYPVFFITQKGHLALIVIQTFFALLFLSNSVHAFKKRAKLIAESQ